MEKMELPEMRVEPAQTYCFYYRRRIIEFTVERRFGNSGILLLPLAAGCTRLPLGESVPYEHNVVPTHMIC